MNLLSWYINHQGAGREAFTDIIECLTGVATGVLGEDFVDDEAVGLAGGFVLEILTRFDLLLIM